MSTLRNYILAVLAVLFCLPVFSQSSQEPFGKNRVQYKDFKWRYITTANFEVYYYGTAIELAIKAGSYAEEDFQRIVDITGYTPAEKIQIILYNSVADKQQSNIGLADQEIMIGGQTVLVKAKIEIAFKGTQIQLMKDVSYGVSYTIMNTIMYGGNVKDVVKSSYLMNLPDWFLSGAAAYISEDWSQEMDNFMRDRVLNGKIKNPTSYSGEEARFIGQSIWNFIGKEYGENNVSNIIGLTRAFRNERLSIESNLGISFYDFLKNWEDYYKKMDLPLSSSYSISPDSTILVSPRRNAKIYSLSMNKEGTYASYVQNYKGRFKLYLVDLKTGKKKKLAKGGYRRVDQAIDYALPISAWQNEFVISAVLRKRENMLMKTFDLKNHKTYKKKLTLFNQIYSMAYSPDGSTLAMSADKDGQTDIFLYSGKTNSTTPLTNDPCDDIDPLYTPSGNLIFSSTRQNDTLAMCKGLPKYSDNYNLFLYNPANKTTFKRLTNNRNNNYLPKGPDEHNLYFLSDEKGIVNIYRLNDDRSITQVTNLSNDITSFEYSKQNPSVLYTSLFKGRDRIYFRKNNWNANSYNTPVTQRKSLVHSYSANDIISNPPAKDTINFNFNSNEESEFNELVFQSQIKKDTTAQANQENKAYMPALDALKYMGPRKYNNPFSADKIITTLMVDPLRGLGALLEGGMSDLLGNHRIDGGGFIGFDFKSSKLFGEYRYVKKRVDFKIRYDRQTVSPYNDYASQRYVLNIISGTASYPLSVNQRISVTPSFLTTTYRETTSYQTIAAKDVIASYESARAEYVYDNTLVTGINMLKGTRFKISAEYYKSNQNVKKDFGLMFMDFRKYIPIHKELTLATRVSYGHYFGNSPKSFLIGGMDNWLLSNHEFYSNQNAATNNPYTIDPGVNNSDILFMRYVTSLRGFKYNTQFGPKYLLFNAELRLPVVQYFYNGTIGSNFLRNLQLIGFTDIGNAYSGKLTNIQDNQTIPGYPFSATVTNYRSPFLIGYGAGVRTMFLGYYVKADLGWGLQNNIVSKPLLYITFGYDF
ncbi:MAG TPA: hypothetical protein VNB90_04930 [Cytophagaceae bacterium]|nr:hypothetical protein [Cytophagaceae bacterium]